MPLGDAVPSGHTAFSWRRQCHGYGGIEDGEAGASYDNLPPVVMADDREGPCCCGCGAPSTVYADPVDLFVGERSYYVNLDRRLDRRARFLDHVTLRTPQIGVEERSGEVREEGTEQMERGAQETREKGGIQHAQGGQEGDMRCGLFDGDIAAPDRERPGEGGATEGGSRNCGNVITRIAAVDGQLIGGEIYEPIPP